MRLRLDVKAEAPILILPVSVTSDCVLVCNLGTLTAVNDFCWHTDVPHAAAADEESRQQEAEACKHCNSGLWWR